MKEEGKDATQQWEDDWDDDDVNDDFSLQLKKELENTPKNWAVSLTCQYIVSNVIFVFEHEIVFYIFSMEKKCLNYQDQKFGAKY